MGQRGLLLDRDGVINIDRGYLSKIEQFEFLKDLFPFLRTLQDRGYRLAILTNQSGVGRGYYSEEDYQQLTKWMLDRLHHEGIRIDLILACFEHPEGTLTAYQRESFWRKPNPGMVLEAIQRLRLDPARSVFIGDTLRDMQAAQGGHIGRCLWLTDQAVTCPPDIHRVTNFDEALHAIPYP